MISDEEFQARIKAFADATSVTMEQFAAGIKAWCDAWPARLMDSAISQQPQGDGDGTQDQ